MNGGWTEYRTCVNGIRVSARYSSRAIREIFLPFLRRLTELRREKGRRILVLLAAPPGAGKTTLAGFLEQLSRDTPDTEEIRALGMDGFHKRQEYLLSHTAQRDGRQIALVEIKGAPVTFDLEGLTAGIRKLAAGETCGWPAYDRLLHNPVEDAVQAQGNIILLEGNYLLLDEDGWRDLAAFADFTVSVRAEEDLLRDRLIERRIRIGTEREAAVRFVDFSDMPNVRLCLGKTMKADMELRIGADGDYFNQQPGKEG